MLIVSITVLIICVPIGIYIVTKLRKQANEIPDPSFDINRNGTKIVFTGRGLGGTDIYLMDVKSKSVTRITQSEFIEYTPTFTPDGETIIYSQGYPGNGVSQLVKYSLKSATTIVLTPLTVYQDIRPSVSSDGKQLVFARGTEAYHEVIKKIYNYDVYVLNLDNLHIRRLTSNAYADVKPVFSPDNKSLFFTAIVSGQKTLTPMLYSASVDAKINPQLLCDLVGGGTLACSPDNRFVVCNTSKTPYDNYDLAQISNDGKVWKLYGLNKDNSFNYSPKFTKDPAYIYYLYKSGEDYINSPCIKRYSLHDGSNSLIATDTLFDAPMSINIKH